MSFGPKVTLDQPVTPVGEWDSPALESGGSAPLGEAIERGIELLEAQKVEHLKDGLPCEKPIFGLLTNGKPGHMTAFDPIWTRIQELLEVAGHDDHFELVAGGVGDGGVDTLRELTDPIDNPVLKVVPAEGAYSEYFRLLAELAVSIRSQQYPTGEMSRLRAAGVKREYDGLHPVE